MTRRSFLGATASAAAGTAALSGTASAHYQYLPVWSTTDLNVRAGPGTNYAIKQVADYRTGGCVQDGPVDANGYRWWKVWWNGDSNNSDVIGWSAERHQQHADFAFPATGWVRSLYGDDRPQKAGNHRGVDVMNDYGTNIYSAREGTVTQTAWYDCGGYNIIIDHGGGWQTYYGHLNANNPFEVSEGQYVDRFQHIGNMGATSADYTDCAFESHVHFEIMYNGDPLAQYATRNADVVANTAVTREYTIGNM